MDEVVCKIHGHFADVAPLAGVGGATEGQAEGEEE
jgi:hypothetical protein